MDLADPATAAILAADALSRAGIPHALYGGLLLAAYGEARETIDADFAVADAPPPAIREALAARGIEARPVFAGVVLGGHAVDRFTLSGGDAATGLNSLDLVRPRSARYRTLALARALTAPLRGSTVCALRPEDFIVFKILSTRDRDLDDATSVLRRSRGSVDMAAVRSEIATLAAEIPDFDVTSRLARLDLASPPG